MPNALRKFVELLRGMTRLESAILLVVVAVSLLHLWNRFAGSLTPQRHLDRQLQSEADDADRNARSPN